MMDEKNDIEPGEIARYRSGTMSEAERHALEKKALSDPFLADALEGAENISAEEFSADVLEISRQFQHHKSNPWLTPLRIAAGLLVVTASGLLLYYFNVPEPARLAFEKSVGPGVGIDSNAVLSRDSSLQLLSLAKTEQPEGETKPSVRKEKPGSTEKPNGGALSDALKSVAGETPAAETQKTETQPVAVSPAEEDKGRIAEAEISDDKKDVVLESAPASKSASGGAGVAGKNESMPQRSAKAKDFQTQSRPNQTIAGRVTSTDDGSALPGVNVLVKGSLEGAVTDTGGNYQLSTQDTSPQLVFSSIGLERKEVNTQYQPGVNVQMSRAAKQRSELSVAGPVVSQNLSLGGVPGTIPIIHLAQPMGGREAFQKYLETKIQYPATALAHKTEGKVTVEFTVTKNGSLINFTIINAIGDGCEEELIRLIRNGPRWTPSKQDSVALQDKVVVQLIFELPR